MKDFSPYYRRTANYHRLFRILHPPLERLFTLFTQHCTSEAAIQAALSSSLYNSPDLVPRYLQRVSRFIDGKIVEIPLNFSP